MLERFQQWGLLRGKNQGAVHEQQSATLSLEDQLAFDTVIGNIKALRKGRGFVAESDVYLPDEDRYRYVIRPAVTEVDIVRYWEGAKKQRSRFDNFAEDVLPATAYHRKDILPPVALSTLLEKFGDKYNTHSNDEFPRSNPHDAMSSFLEEAEGMLEIAGQFEASNEVIKTIVFAEDPDTLLHGMKKLHLANSIRGNLISMVQNLYANKNDRLSKATKDTYQKEFEHIVGSAIKSLHPQQNHLYLYCLKYIEMNAHNMPEEGKLNGTHKLTFNGNVKDTRRALAEGLDFYGLGMHETVDEFYDELQPREDDTVRTLAIKEHHKERWFGGVTRKKVAAGILTTALATQAPSVLKPSVIDVASAHHSRSAAYVQDGMYNMAVSNAAREAAESVFGEKPTTIYQSQESNPIPVEARYGSQLFSLDDEANLREFYEETEKVADFFDVPAQYIIGLLDAENNGAGLLYHQPEVSSAEAHGIAQVVDGTRMGWFNENYISNITDVREVTRVEGLGFDWELRNEYRAWEEGRSDGALLARANTDPNKFHNALAMVARHLKYRGLTNELAQKNIHEFNLAYIDAACIYNAGKLCDEAGNYTQSADNLKTTMEYALGALEASQRVAPYFADNQNVRTNESRDASSTTIQQVGNLYAEMIDAKFGIGLTTQDMGLELSRYRQLLGRVEHGEVSVSEAAHEMLLNATAEVMASNWQASLDGVEPSVVPFRNAKELLFWEYVIQKLGRPIDAHLFYDIIARNPNDESAWRRELSGMGEVQVVERAREMIGDWLLRPARNIEIQTMVYPLMAEYNFDSMEDQEVDSILGKLEGKLQSIAPRDVDRNPGKFDAYPLQPMPNVFKGFGVAVGYQIGGLHTGIDVANPRGTDGKEPPIYAVDDAEVAHVGPLYVQEVEGGQMAGRGEEVIILELDPEEYGPYVYAIYNHNSEAHVQKDQDVASGQPIGRQGDEGYSFGSHLHFEIHIGAQFTGNWQRPFDGGEFVDPLKYFPQNN